MKSDFSIFFKTSVLLLVLFTHSIHSTYANEEKELGTILTKMGIRYENIAQELGVAYWYFYSAEAEADLKTPKDKFYTLLINDTLNTLIDTWYPNLSEIKDTILKAQVEKWHNVLLSAKVEYDAEIMKLRNELEEMLQVSGEKDNSDYDFESNMLKLIELRNKKSVELGYKNYIHLSFETNGLGYEWFMNFIDEMDKSTLDRYTALVEKTKIENDINEFGQRNAFQFIGQFYGNNDPAKVKDSDNIELVRKSLANIGISYNELPAKLVEMKLPEGVGGQGLMINIPNDFRAVMTLGMEISTWMHEMGHGLHGLYNSINKPVLEGYEWIPGNANPSFAEGMAETSAWFTRNIEWQKEYTNLTEEEIANRKETVNTYITAFIRYHLFNFMRETELYLHPEKTYEKIQKELAKKYLLIETEDIRTQSIASIIYVSYPLYLQNYLIADMVACQVHSTLEEKFGKDYAFNNDVGAYLIKNFYSSGEYYNWNDRLIHGTGKPLDIESYLKYYKIK
ncbi:MAG TPA: hypothetical protein DCG75_11610 [Bacteroidales bacterium]|nr:hypothetical protein [Bacteroidales bacterium]